MRRPALLGFLSIVAVFSLFAEDAGAVKLGPVEVHPYVELNSVYDDNIFVQNSNEVEDWYFLISPGLLVQHIHGDNHYELEYRADIYRYVDTGAANDVEDHNLRAAISINRPSGLSFSLNDLAKRGHEPRSESNFGVVSLNEVNRYWSNDADIEVAYKFSDRFKLAAAYKNYFIEYDLDTQKFRDRVDNGVGATLYYRFMPKTSLLMQGIYKNVDHLEDNLPAAIRLDSNEYWAMAGLTWDITDKSTGTVKGGYEWKQFDSSGSRDFHSPVYIVSINHRFTPKTSFTLSGLRQASETDDPASPYYTTTQGMLELSFNPIRRLVVKPYGSVTSNRYSGATTVSGDTARRLDLVWLGGVDVSYKLFKYLSFTAGYKHTKRSSTITAYDYTDNMVTLGFKATL